MTEADIRRELDALAEAAMTRADVPGLAVAVVDAQRTILVAAWGLADLETRRAVSEHTRFMLGSTSKPVVSAVIGALVCRAMLDVDADVERWLAFPARNPAFPQVPITMRRLLQHRASIRDDLDAMRANVVDGDSPIRLEPWLRERLATPNGFTPCAPGTAELYSNTGWALAALVAERAADMEFSRLCEALLFGPLGIGRARWKLGGTDPSDLARPHAGGFGEPLRRVAHYGYPDYPSGSLRISASELGRFVSFVVGRGTFGGRVVVDADWMTATERGLGWRQLGPQRFGLDGLDRGVGTRITVDRASGVGIAILGNAAWPHPAARADVLVALERSLFDLGSAGSGRSDQ